MPCPDGSTSACYLLADAGLTWSLGPVSSWCVHNATIVQGPNGSYDAGEWFCAATPAILSFNMTESGTLSGSLNVSGPFSLWVVASGLSCGLLWWKIAHIAIPGCPPPVGPVSNFTWNLSVSAGGSVDLSAYSDNPGLLAPGPWEFLIVNSGASNETATVTSDVIFTSA